MIQINLLPWRERAREIKKKKFYISLVITIALTFFIILLFHIYYDDLISYQDSRNAFLRDEIVQKQNELNELRKQKDQQALIQTKLKFLLGLRGKSYDAVRLLNELIKIVPDSIILSKLVRTGNLITIEGSAQSDLAITAFLKSISEIPIFMQPALTGINTGQDKAASTEKYFQIKVEQIAEIEETSLSVIEKAKEDKAKSENETKGKQ